MKGGPPPTEGPHRQAAAATTTTMTIRRLSRNFKISQHAQTCSERSEAPSAAKPNDLGNEFRKALCRVSGAPGGESLREADSDPDIIWDATSPPRRPRGKRAKHRAPGPVSINDIVSRIAPERGRPRLSEPALQRWIGDSAGIPCTPDVQPPPKSRRTSPRASNSLADDLLKLAKRFDLNWIGGHDRDDDLGSGRRPPDGHVRDPAASSSADFATALRSDVPDDDDLLDDSLLAEVTQNPENFSSTQKTSCQVVAPPPLTPRRVGPLGKSETASALVPAFFSREPPWDDPADNEMLRRLCEDLESRVGREAPDHSATSSVPDRFPIGGGPVSTATKKSLSVSTNGTVPAVTGETVSSVTKRAVDICPVSMVMHHPVSMVTSKEVCKSQRAPLALVRQAKCSAQEIERKKQQALERRRRRLLGGGPHPQMRSASLL